MIVKIHPKWGFAANGFKSIDDAEELMTTQGEGLQITTSSLTTSKNIRGIFLERDVTFTGKFSMSLILHGDINVKFEKADVINNFSGQPPILLARDFSGTLTIVDSNLHYDGGALDTDGTAIGVESPDAMASQVKIVNSTIEGIMIKTESLQMIDNINIVTKATSLQGMASVLVAEVFDASHAHIVNDGAIACMALDQSGQIERMTVKAGPVYFNGNWDIGKIDIDMTSKRARNQLEVLKFQPVEKDINSSAMHVTLEKGVEIIHASKEASIIYAYNTRFILKSGIVGNVDRPFVYKASIENSTVRNDGAEENLVWTATGDCVYVKNIRGETGLEREAKMHPKSLTMTTADTGVIPNPSSNSNNNYRRMPPEGPKSDDRTFEERHKDDNFIQDNKAEEPVDPLKPKEPKLDKDGNKIKTPQEKLNELIGLKTVKAKLNAYVANAKLNAIKKNKGFGTSKNLSRHLVFGGNPGTGKTTVAQLVAEILHDNGALPSSYLSTVTAKDLIGQYLGETQQKTHKAFVDVADHGGGVLFIDEAYSLKEDSQFNKDAVAQILTDAVDYRDKIIVILAGYTNAMHEFFDTANAGLRSRFTNWVDFPDYTPKERLQIFDLMCKNQNVLFGRNKKYHDSYMTSKQFKFLMNYYNRDHSNGRSVANFVQDLIMTRDTRLAALPLEKLDKLGEVDLSLINARDLQTLYVQDVNAYKKEKERLQKNVHNA